MLKIRAIMVSTCGQQTIESLRHANSDFMRRTIISGTDDSPSPRFNLLRMWPVRVLFRSPLFIYLIQTATLTLFVWLAISGWGIFAPEGVQSKQFAKTNAVTILIWGLWWPTIIWGAVLFGRIWCAACPLELIANITERIGRLTGFKQRTLGRWLQSGILILAFYTSIQMLVAGVQLHRIPAYTSIFLWSLLILSAVVGFTFKDRAFCRGFCPVGLLLSTYGRGGILAVRSVSSDTCDACLGKDCVQIDYRTRLDAPQLSEPPKSDRVEG